MDQELNPSVKKILDYATGKSVITYDEVTVLVGQDFVNSPEWETVLQLLAKQNIQIIEQKVRTHLAFETQVLHFCLVSLSPFFNSPCICLKSIIDK